MSLKKTRKQLVSAALVAMLTLVAGVPAMVANAPVVFAGGQGEVNYTDSAGNAWGIYTDRNSEEYGRIYRIDVAPGVTNLVIPETINGIRVKGIMWANAIMSFSNCSQLKSIMLPTGVVPSDSYLDENDEVEILLDPEVEAFLDEECPNLTELKVPTNHPYYVNGKNGTLLNKKDQTQIVWFPSGNTGSQTTPTTPTTSTTPTPSQSGNSSSNPSKLMYNGRAYDGCITLDTANYIMSPGNVYDIGNVMKDSTGKTLSNDQIRELVANKKLKVTDSRNGSVVSLTQLPNGNFRVTGKKEGTTYIVYDIGNSHASVRIDVQKGVKQHGTAVRNTSYYMNK